jgi:glycosyltransferase involved in cell wall biosynthesis
VKKILYVLPGLSAGGAEKAAILVANELTRNHGYSVSILIFTEELYYQKLLDPRVELIYRNLYQKQSRFQRIISTYLKCGMYLNAHLDKNEYDVVVSGYEVDGELPVIEMLLKNMFCFRKSQIRYVSVIQASLRGIHQKHHTRRNLFVLSLIAFFRWRLFHRIIVVASTILDECPRSVRNNIAVIPNPVDRAIIFKNADEPLSPSDNDALTLPYFINIARISYQKNQMGLVKAFNAIKAKTDWNLALIGVISDKAYYADVVAFIRANDLAQRVFYLGTPDNPYAYLKRAEAFVFSSRYEGNSLAILEAMVLGKVIVSTKFIGYENILSDENAILVGNEDEEELAQAMLRVANGTVKQDQLIENASSLAASYEISVIAQQYHAVFSNL